MPRRPSPSPDQNLERSVQFLNLQSVGAAHYCSGEVGKSAVTPGPGGYGQFCPLAMASEVLCNRWTMVVLRELLCGSTRFNELRRGVPRMSPALLSKRLRELQDAGLVERRGGGRRGPSYHLTPAGEDLREIVLGLGHWGQRWIDTRHSLRNLDPSLLMWDMRRRIDPAPIPEGRRVIQFTYPDLPPSRRTWWLIVDRPAEIDLCSVDPGLEVDLYVETDLATMTSVWMGYTSVVRAVREERLYLSGDQLLAYRMQRWLGLSSFARDPLRESAAGDGRRAAR